MNRNCAAHYSRVFSVCAVLGAALSLPAASHAAQVLQLNGATLTSYRAPVTSIQDVLPQHFNRGVNINGTLRLPSAFDLALAGNTFDEPWNNKHWMGDVRLDAGVYSPTEIDISLPAPGFRWQIGRSHNARQNNGSYRDSDGYQGKNWAQLSQPEIALYDNDNDPGTKQEQDVLYIVYGADRYIECARTDDNSDIFQAKNGAAGGAKFTAGTGGEPDTYTYYDQHGTQAVFFGLTSAGSAAWQLWKITDAAGNTAFIGDATTGSTAISSGYSSGRILKAYDSANRRYTYTYTTLDSVPLTCPGKPEPV